MRGAFHHTAAHVGLSSKAQRLANWKPKTRLRYAVLRMLDDMFPRVSEREHIAEFVRPLCAKNLDGISVTPKDATCTNL